MNTKSIRHEEYTYQGRRVILDAALLAPGQYETMLLYRSNGAEIASYTDGTEAEALRHFDAIRAAHLPDREREAVQPLAGRYAKPGTISGRRWPSAWRLPPGSKMAGRAATTPGPPAPPGGTPGWWSGPAERPGRLLYLEPL